MGSQPDNDSQVVKKVLILAYDFPPYTSVGALRPYSWFRYLNEFGFYPIVVTRQWSNLHGNYLDYINSADCKQTIIEKTENGTQIKTCYKPTLANKLMIKYGKDRFRFVRRFISAFYEIFQWFLPIGSKIEIYRSARSYLRENKADVIIATGDPFILFRYAAKLSKEFNTPWIADYRDVWVVDNITGFRARLWKIWENHIEKHTVKKSAGIMTVSEFTLNKIKRNRFKQKGFVIQNGYDPEEIEKANHIVQHTGCLSLACVGTIYNYYPFLEFLEALENFIKENPSKCVHLNLYGLSFENHQNETIFNQRFSKSSFITVFSRIPQNELLQELAGNNILMLFNNYSFLGTKIFDFIALKRKILFCYTQDPDGMALKEKYFPLFAENEEFSLIQQAMIEDTRSGILVKNKFHLTEVLNSLCDEFEKNKCISCQSKDIERYSRRLQTKLLADILKNNF